MTNLTNSIINEKTYTIKELASVLKCTPQTVRNYIRGKKLKALKLNNRVYITETALNEFINAYTKVI